MDLTVDSRRDFFAYSPEVSLVANLDGRILAHNEAAAEALGVDAGETMLLGECVHPDDRTVFNAAWARLAPGSESVRFQCRIHDAGGRYRAFACSARQAPRDHEVYVVLAMREDKAEQPARILRAILDNLPICVWVFDREGNYVFNDGKGLEAAGLKPGQLVGMNAFKIHPGAVTKNFHRTLAGEVRHNVTEAYNQWWENWILPVRNDEGEVAFVVGASLNVTESKRIEQEMLAKIDVIEKQQAVIRNLGTPVIEVWDKVLTLPLMGMIDTARAAEIMESLLLRIVQSGARYAILDLTGVDTVDTAAATHVVRLVGAIRLLGAEGVITGIRPNVAQAMVGLGLDLSSIVTVANLREGLKHCMKRMKQSG